MTTATRYDCVETFDPEILDQCRALDRIGYDAAYQKDLELETALFRKNPRSRVIARHEGELIGYIEMLPVTTEAFERFLNTRDQVFDQLIEPAFISPWIKGKPVDIYGSSAVVRSDHQHNLIYPGLLNTLFGAFRDLEREGYQLGRYGTTAVSIAGVRVCEQMWGLKPLFPIAGGNVYRSEMRTIMAYFDRYLGA